MDKTYTLSMFHAAMENILLILKMEKQLFQCRKYLNMLKHWEKNIKNICGIIRTKKEMYNPHKKIKNLFFLSEYIRKRKTSTNYIVTEILIVDNCKHPFCMNSWCFKISGTRLYGGDIPMSWKLTFLFKKMMVAIKKEAIFLIKNIL